MVVPSRRGGRTLVLDGDELAGGAAAHEAGDAKLPGPTHKQGHERTI